MQDFKKYIVPFVDNEAMGCGFFIRDYFITAGHMFDEAETHTIYFNGAYHTFNRADAVFLKSFKDGASDVETQDIAIFKFEGVDSPLRFSDKIPSANTALTNISFIPVSNCINPFDTLITDCIVTRPFIIRKTKRATPPERTVRKIKTKRDIKTKRSVPPVRFF